MAREQWNVRNVTSRQIGIGDLMFVPVIEPGQSVDLLRHHPYDELEQSNDLATLLRMGWLRLTKTKNPTFDSIDRAEIDEVDTKDSSVTSTLQNQIESLNFIDLIDVPDDYTDDENKVLIVRTDGQGVTFTNVTEGAPDSLDDIPDVTITNPTNQQRIVYDGDSGQWVNRTNPEAITHIDNGDSPYTATTSTGVILVDTSGGAVTVNIPVSDEFNDGDRISVFKETSDVNTVTVQVTGQAQNVGGLSTQVVSKQNSGISCLSDYNGGSSPAWEITQNSRTNTREIVVDATAGVGDVSTIADAITRANALSPSASSPVAIVVQPGTYTVSATVVLASGVFMTGIGRPTLSTTATTDPVIELQGSSRAYDIHVTGANGAGGSGFAFLGGGSGSRCNVLFCSVQDCETGYLCDATGKMMQMSGGAVFGTGAAPITSGIKCADGTVVATSMRLLGADGPTGLTYAVHATGASSEVSIQSCAIDYATNGLYADVNSEIEAQACRFHECTNVFRIPATGAAAELILQSCHTEETGSYDLLVESATAEIQVAATSIDDDKTLLTTGCTYLGAVINRLAGDKGVDIKGELHVGTPGNPAESVFGAGDSYVRGMLVYTYNPSGSVYTDVTTEAQSSSGSTFGFPANAVNNAIYVSSDLQYNSDYLQHFGVKASIDTAAVPGSGEIVAEYWDGSDWTEFNLMVTDSGSPYQTKANAIFEQTGSTQVRYDWRLRTSAYNWTKNDPMSEGTNRYWMRYRINTSALTTLPIIEQLKVHSNRTEINDDGYKRPKVKTAGLALRMKLDKDFNEKTLYNISLVNERAL
jgi:hypothetical protein